MQKIREFCDMCKQEVGEGFRYGYLNSIDLPAVESFIPLDSCAWDEKISTRRLYLCKSCFNAIIKAIQKTEKSIQKKTHKNQFQ